MKNTKTNRYILSLTLTLLTVFSCAVNDRFDDAIPEMKLPYIALNITTKTRVAITNDKNYQNELERQFGVNRKQIKALFDYLQKYPKLDEIKIKAATELQKSIKEFETLTGDEQSNFFIINILAPYLTMLVNSVHINNSDEEEIYALFARVFDTDNDEINPLAQLAQGTYEYHYGGSFKSVYLYRLNSYLKKHGFCLEYGVREKIANVFKIDYAICDDKEWRSDKKISILVLTRIYPHLMSSKLGYAPANHSDVFILKDRHYYHTKDYRSEFGKKIPRNPYKNSSQEKLWKSLALDIDLMRANRIRWELAYKDLSKGGFSQNQKNLIIHTALHEAKHRIDEIDMPEMRLNLDMEVSAYLTTAITGVYPSLGLRETIEWAEAYYQGTKYTKLRYLLGELWGLADKSLRENYSDERLKAELRKIYENYRTIQWDARFTDLTEFEQRMAPVIIR